MALLSLAICTDATNSGSTGEGTAILANWCKYCVGEARSLPDHDGRTRTPSRRPGGRGIHATYRAKLGGVRDTRFSTAIELDVEVVNLFDAKFTLTGHIAQDVPIDIGPSGSASSTAV